MHEARTAPDCDNHPEPAPITSTSTVIECDLDAEMLRAARSFLVARRLTRIGLGITALGVIAVGAVTLAVLRAELLVPSVAIWGAYTALGVGVAFWALANGGRHLTADQLWSLLRLHATPPDGWSDSLLVNARRILRSGPLGGSADSSEEPNRQPS
ncbi:hypothetical protein MOQ72_05455 [Saccharopolyspora sp. K220]|uniref:hypothetical protein n=1 Tax=Saccharopolyspora soli TaxID=2926618 RepID=UPI001F56318C|nr:hypothetical protein [Saccharopolyspora soli]MCI2416864.1 hypothetical protein [Saccharopolyspora soli]